MTINEVIERVREEEASGKTMRYRYGFGFRGAEWSTVTGDALIKSMENGNWAHFDLHGGDDWFGINFYSSNDMW